MHKMRSPKVAPKSSPAGKTPPQFKPGFEVPMQCEPTESYPVRRRYYQAGGEKPGKLPHWE